MAHYRKNYLCICEGQQEVMYLEHVANLLKDFPRKVIKFNTYIDSPQRIKKTYEEYDSAILFDYDFKDVIFKKNIEFCDKQNKGNKPTKKRDGRFVHHAYSNVNFDLWLILHKEEYNWPVSRNDAYMSDVRRIYGLNQEENIKSKDVINKILEQIKLEDIKDAIQRANRIRSLKLEEDKIISSTSICYSNPDFSIHEFLRDVLKDCGDL